MRPEAPFYVGRTRPSAIGWTRIGITLIGGALMAVLIAQRLDLLPALIILALFAALALWTWMGQWTRFIVDEHGVTVSLGGFWPQRPWPLAHFRLVQLRRFDASHAGATLGGYGWRRARIRPAQPHEITPVGGGKVFTLDDIKSPYRVLATGPGTMVEIIGREGTHYLLDAEDPQATAAAVDQAIRARR